MLIHLDDYRRAKANARREASAPRPDWNPAYGVIALPRSARPLEPSPALPEDTAAVEPAFMTRVCALASQI